MFPNANEAKGLTKFAFNSLCQTCKRFTLELVNLFGALCGNTRLLNFIYFVLDDREDSSFRMQPSFPKRLLNPELHSALSQLALSPTLAAKSYLAAFTISEEPGLLESHKNNIRIGITPGLVNGDGRTEILSNGEPSERLPNGEHIPECSTLEVSRRRIRV